MKNGDNQSALRAVTIEDSPLVADRLKATIKELNFIEYIGNATNIDDSLVLIQEYLPQIAFIDIQLKEEAPQRTGIDLVVLLRKQYPDMVIIIFTNISATQYRNKCMALGANHYLDKSNDFDRIPDILKSTYQSQIISL